MFLLNISFPPLGQQKKKQSSDEFANGALFFYVQSVMVGW